MVSVSGNTTGKVRLLLAPGHSVPGWAQRVKEEAAKAHPFDVVIPEDDSEQGLLRHIGEADALLTYMGEIPASVIRAGKRLKLIQKHGSNWRNIDVAAATEQNIPVATNGLGRSITVAEHAMAILLACARKVVQGHLAVTQGVYQQMGLEPMVTSQQNYRANWPKVEGVTELHDTTFGIIGMGDIGMEIAKRARAFDMSLVYYDRDRHSSAMEESLSLKYLPFDELLKTSDYVITILPHTTHTENLMGAKQFALMKPSAIFINTSRGPLVDEDALIAALKEGRIAMAGLDVFRREPLPIDSPLMTLPNVVLLPHMGGGSYRWKEQDIPGSLANIARFFTGEGARGIINQKSGGAHAK